MTKDEWTKLFMEQTDNIARLSVAVSQSTLVAALTHFTDSIHNNPTLAALSLQSTWERALRSYKSTVAEDDQLFYVKRLYANRGIILGPDTRKKNSLTELLK